VHNTHVIRDLERRGAVFVSDLYDVPDGATVIFSARGVSPAVRAEAGRLGHDTIDATCPLVTKVHREAVRPHGQSTDKRLLSQVSRSVSGLAADLGNRKPGVLLSLSRLRVPRSVPGRRVYKSVYRSGG
jgi:LytB protein